MTLLINLINIQIVCKTFKCSRRQKVDPFVRSLSCVVPRKGNFCLFILTLCMLGNFLLLLSSADFFQNKLLPKILSEICTIRVSVILSLGPNCLQRLSVDDKRHR